MTANEFTEHFVRFLQAKRNHPGLDHAGHFDSVKFKWIESILDTDISCPMELRYLEAKEAVEKEMQSIERDFNRR